MSQASDPGAKLLAGYRAATRMRPEQRERALRKLHARLSADPMPSLPPEVPVPELPPPLPAAWVQLRARWQRFVTVSKAITGAALLTWLATTPDERATAAELASRASTPLTAARNGADQFTGRSGTASPDERVSAAPVEQQGSTAASSDQPSTSPDRAGGVETAGLEAMPSTGAQSPQAADRHIGLSRHRASAQSLQARDRRIGSSTEASPTDSPSERVAVEQSATSATWPERVAAAPSEVSATWPEGASSTRARSARAPALELLEQETLLLEQAQAALKRGDAERALHLLAEHTWLFPAGRLAEARDVARILALCQAGHAAQARSRAKSFLATRPHSPFGARVRSSCPNAEKPPSAR